MIESFSSLIPPSLLSASGKVFYSGRTAFSTPSKLYLLGLNPGGAPTDHATETVGSHTRKVLSDLEEWSAYRDESWEGRPPGTHKMQMRVLHLLHRLHLEPTRTPASNLVFVRSARATGLEDRLFDLEELCWPFHQNVIEQLGVRVVLCFGKDCGQIVCEKLQAKVPVDQFVEANNRRWSTTAFTNSGKLAVVVATHPSIADWTSPATDPSPLVERVIAGIK